MTPPRQSICERCGTALVEGVESAICGRCSAELQAQTDDRRQREVNGLHERLPQHEIHARDHAFKRSIGFTMREGVLWDEAWIAARSYYLARVGGERDVRQ